MQEPIIVERDLDAPIAAVWQALTDRDTMAKWYFDLERFEPREGFEFQFYGGTEEKQWLHLCRVTDVIPQKKISYTWRYDGHPGNSLVTFELTEAGPDKTHLRLTHSGVETFPQEVKEMRRESFVAGWNSIVNENLVRFFLQEDKSTKE